MNNGLRQEKIEILNSIFTKKYNGFTTEEIKEIQEVGKDISFNEILSYFLYVGENEELLEQIGDGETKVIGIIGSLYTLTELQTIGNEFDYSIMMECMKFRTEKGLENDYELDYEDLINECIEKSKTYDVMQLYSKSYKHLNDNYKMKVFEYLNEKKSEIPISTEAIEPFIELLKIGHRNGYDISSFWGYIYEFGLKELCEKDETELLELFYEKANDVDKKMIDAFRKIKNFGVITNEEFTNLFYNLPDDTMHDRNNKILVAQYAVEKGYIPPLKELRRSYFSNIETQKILTNANLVYYLLTKTDDDYTNARIYESITSPETKLAFIALKDYINEQSAYGEIPQIYYELEELLKVENLPKYFDEEGIKPELLKDLLKKTKIDNDNKNIITYFISKSKNRMVEEDKIYCEFIETAINTSNELLDNFITNHNNEIRDQESFNSFISDDEKIISILKENYIKPYALIFGLLKIDKLNDNIINNSFTKEEIYTLDVVKELVNKGVQEYSFLFKLFNESTLIEENGINKDNLITYILNENKIDIVMLLSDKYITSQQREFFKTIKPVFGIEIEPEKRKMLNDILITPESLDIYISDNKVTATLIDNFFNLGLLNCINGHEKLLTDIQKDIYNVYQSIEDLEVKKVYCEFIEGSYSSIISGTIPKKVITQIPELLDLIRLSNSSEIAGRYVNIAKLILQNTNDSNFEPLEQFEKIEKIFLTKDLSHMDKIFKSFQLLYPHEKLINTIKEKSDSISPTLYKYATSPDETILGKEALRIYGDSTYAVEMIMYADLLKTTIASNDRTFIDYIDNIEKGNQIFTHLMAGEKDILTLQGSDKFILSTYIYHLQSLYNKYHPENKVEMTNDLNINLELLMNLYNDIDLSLFPDSIIKSNYYAYLGIDTMEKIKSVMNSARKDATEKGYEYAKTPMKLEKGDIIKGIGGIKYFDTIIQNGSVSKEFLGGDIGSDLTPFDTDLSIITETKENNEASRNGIEANNYGPIFFVIKNALEKYNCTRDNEKENFILDETPENFGRIEIFETLSSTHYGVRTGFPTTQIDYILCEDKTLIDKMGLVLAKNGIYIPIVNKEGNLLFTPDNYKYLRGRMAGLSRYNVDNFEVDKTASNDMTRNLISAIAENVEETKKLKQALEEKIRVGFAASGLITKTQIDGDMQPGSVELIDTGSTGRGTNQIGDGDFDFTIRLDRVLSKSKVEEIVSKVHEELGIGSKSGDIRKEKVILDDKEVEIDISYAQKSDGITYTTDMSLSDRLETIKRQDPEQHLLVLANIVLAKTLLKKGECYKPRHARENAQGGLGGVGTENWILQNGGSLEAAATEFLIAAGIMRIEEKEDGAKQVVIDENTQKEYSEFKTTYSIWDFGQNQLSETRLRDFPYDNFVLNNMDQNGYMRMAKTMQTYILELHPEITFVPKPIPQNENIKEKEVREKQETTINGIREILQGLKQTIYSNGEDIEVRQVK